MTNFNFRETIGTAIRAERVCEMRLQKSLENKKIYEIDMCTGKIFPKLIAFAIPLMLSGVLQLLFNAVDIIVVGRYSGSTALAAVGATSALIVMLINGFIGISVGSNVLAAQSFAAGRAKEMEETVHTSIMAALLFGIGLIFLGNFLAHPLLALMDTPEDVLPLSVLYMRIYFCGMPFLMSYNFGAAILRAIGDTRRPLLYLFLSGITNVVMNLVLVSIFHLGVAGVAIATVISQALSAALIIRSLCKSEGIYHLDLKHLGINGKVLVRMLKIGLPAGVQGMCINFSNVLIQSSVNSFGSLAMAGFTAAGNLDGFLYVSVNAFTQACLSFTSQNVGVGNNKRVDKILGECISIVLVLGTVLGSGMYFMGERLLHLYSTDPAVVQYGLEKMAIICIPYGLLGVMDVIPGCLRGMGNSLSTMLLTLTGVCLFRVFWVFVIFPMDRTLTNLYISYPVSWMLTILMQGTCFWVIRRKKMRASLS